MKEKRRWLLAGLLLFVFAITGCSFPHNAEKIATAPDPIVVASEVRRSGCSSRQSRAECRSRRTKINIRN